MKFHDKIRATELRREGRSYSEILKKIKVSKSTLSLWLRHIELSKDQQHHLYVTLRQQNAYNLAKGKREEKIRLTKRIINVALEEFIELMNDTEFIAGLMLYWAEGDKAETTEMVKFTNSDPAMIVFMMKWFRQICNVPENKFRIALHIHNLHCRKDIEKYWSKITKIPLLQFNKTQIKLTTLTQRRNALYDGTCSIRICNKNLFRKIKGWKLGFQKKFNLNQMTP